MNANFLTAQWLSAMILLLERGNTQAVKDALEEFQSQIEEDLLIITLNEEAHA